MKENKCEFCKKILSEEKLETEHGCLDCHGYIYRSDDGSFFCAHCIDNESKLMKQENARLREALRKISEHETSENKYNSYAQAYNEIAFFAREALGVK